MTKYFRQSTASQEVTLGPFVDSTDANTEETGLTINAADILLHKHGGTTLPAKNSGGGTHISNGIYSIVLDATDTNTIGNLDIYCHISGALWVKVPCVVLDEAVYDALFGTVALATATNITGGVITTVTNLTNLPTIPANWLTAAGTAADFTTEIQAGLATSAALAAVAVFVDTEVASILAAVDTEVAAILALLDDARGEPGQGNPPVNPDAMTKIDYLYKAFRNRITQTATEFAIYADNGTTKDHEAVVSDDGVTFERGELTTGA